MLADKYIAVVVPAYNEERLIGRVLETMPAFVDLVVVVDDCSRDSTVAQVQEFMDNNQAGYCLILSQHEQNQGVGAAIASGYRIAVAEGADVVAVMAGDAQMDPDELGRVVSPVIRGEADYAKGNRLFTGEAWTQIPRHRYLGNAFLSLLTKIASGYWHVADSQTGYTAISREALETLPLDKLYKRYGYPNHLLVMLNIYSFRVMDVPVRPVYNIGEVSGIRLYKVIPTLSWLLLRAFFWRLKERYIIRDFHPLIFFYLLGTALFVPGTLFGLWLVAYRVLIDQVSATSALFAVFLTTSGLQLLLFAMWFDMETNRDICIRPIRGPGRHG
jgi:glycosyltransferase involved in cell wall biosynthesis